MVWCLDVRCLDVRCVEGAMLCLGGAVLLHETSAIP